MNKVLHKGFQNFTTMNDKDFLKRFFLLVNDFYKETIDGSVPSSSLEGEASHKWISLETKSFLVRVSLDYFYQIFYVKIFQNNFS